MKVSRLFVAPAKQKKCAIALSTNKKVLFLAVEIILFSEIYWGGAKIYRLEPVVTH
jgi:hypothetical protein